MNILRIALILIFVPTLTWGQSNLDYKLYSKVIEDYIAEGIKNDVATSEVVIMTKYIPTENEVSFYGKEFLKEDDKIINNVLFYDEVKIKLFRDEEIRKGIISLENKFFETPVLEANKFILEPKVIAISNKKFKSYFKTLFGRRILKGWKKFYKKYSGAHGIFEFSKVIYEGDYALFYVGRHCNGLCGSGDLVIMKKSNDKWDIVTYLNIWMA